MLLSREWPCGGAKVQFKWCKRSGLHHTEGSLFHHSAQSMCELAPVSRDHSMWVHVLMELMQGPPVANSGGAHSNLWRTASWVFKGTDLSVTTLDHPCHRNTHKSHGWAGCPCQPSTTGGPPATRTMKEMCNTASKGWVLGALDLQGLTECPESEQKQARDRELLLKWEHLFVHSDLDLGKTALIKHKIQLTDWTCPSKSITSTYPLICMMIVRAHIQEMLDIRAIP